MRQTKPIIAVDGPAGAGKSTVAKTVARRLGFLYIDTGAMYRALTWKALVRHVDPGDEKKVVPLVRSSVLKLRPASGGGVRVIIDGRDVTRQIRSERISTHTNTLASIPGVRGIVRRWQRRMGKDGGVVMEGRDIGSAVFPDAGFKFYLDASVHERALRRYRELKESGEKVTLAQVASSIRRRDRKDRRRSAGPLKKAAGAVTIDSTSLSVHRVAAAIIRRITGEGQ